MNPYQSPFPDEFKDEQTVKYEAAIEAHEKLVNGLRDRIGQLEAENAKLNWIVYGTPIVFGFQMESADIGG